MISDDFKDYLLDNLLSILQEGCIEGHIKQI